MAKEKIELSLQDESGQECVAYPFVESTDVSLSNGMDIETMIAQDVSLPTIVHSETSFKAGVGDSDVSNSIVDSSVASMTIKGQTYQNILPEPSLRNAMTDGKTMQKLNEGYENVEVVDGVSKSAILKGQTLVNLSPKYNGEKTTFFSVDGSGFTSEYNNDYYKIIANGSNCNIALRLYTNANWQTTQPLKLNTTYLAIVDLDVQVSKNISLQCGKVSYSGVYGKTSIPNNGRQRVALKITTPSEIDGTINIGTDLYSNSGDYVAFYSIILIEYQQGMENWDIPYFTGMASCKMPVLTTTGKNLSPIAEYSGLLEGDGENSRINRLIKKNIELSKDKTYILSGVFSHVGFNPKLLLSNEPLNDSFIEDSAGTTHNSTYKTVVNTMGGKELDWNVAFSGYKYAHLTTGGSQIGLNDYIGETIYITNIQLEEGSTATSYQPYKTNILSTPEEVALRSFNGVKDTLNLMTGEYVQCIKEMVLNGNETYTSVTYTHNNTNLRFDLYLDDIKTTTYDGLLCDKLPVLTREMTPEGEHTKSYIAGHTSSNCLVIVIEKSKLPSEDIEGFKAWLQSNPLTIQYELKTPIVKTVDLSSSGNWEKVVLDGSENWARHGAYGSVTRFNVTIPRMAIDSYHVFSDTLPRGVVGTNDLECINNHYSANQLQIQIKTSKLSSDTVDGFKQYLQQNPITVWYQTQTHQDSTNVKEMLSFSNGHVQLSSGVENSLIPNLSYEVPTSNSYHLDLAKASTQYTMKSSQSTGTFTIDGTQYNVTSNGVFTTPSSMTDKLMITSSSVSDMMLLEGDMREKDIPYFKGIKSAFEDESKIEVLLTGKNLIDETLWTKSIIEDGVECLYGDGWYSSSGSVGTPILIPVDIKQGKRYRISVTHKATTHFNNYKILQDCLNNRIVGGAQSVCILDRLNTFTESNTSFVANFDAKYLMVDTGNPKCYGYIKKGTLIIEEIERNGVITAYEPYKSNNTKIPLLSPLRSLPNGVCDEIILDRENNKAQIIQRVGSIVLDGSDSEEWHFAESNRPDTNTHYVVCANSKAFGERLGKLYSDVSHGVKAFFQDKFAEQAITVWKENGMEMFALHLQNPTHDRVIQVKILKNRLHSTTIEAFREWLSLNPITVYYELETPIITEVELEGFPYTYKDGHIFLNGEIAPVTEIKYSINQQHQIEASNQDIIRHQKEIDYLYKLIGEYVRVDYKNTLLSLNLELK